MTPESLNPFSSLVVRFEVGEVDKTELVQALPAAICGTWKLDGEVNEHTFEGLFNKSVGGPSRVRIALALIRGLLLTRSDDELDGNTRGKMFNFFDEVLGDTAYKYAGFDSRIQNIEKSSKLIGLYQEVIEGTKNLASSIASIPHGVTEFNSLKQKVASTLNHRVTKFLMAPFWREVDGFDEALMAVGGYIENRDELTYDAYDFALGESERYLEQVTEGGSIDLDRSHGQIIRSLVDLIKADMAGRPMAQTPNILITKTPKRYPMHQTDDEFSVDIVISNTGPGIAKNVNINISTNTSLSALRSDQSIGDLGASDSTTLSVPFRVNKVVIDDDIMISIEWLNFDGSGGSTDDTITIDGQDPDLDWQALGDKNPYSLDPIANRTQLFGRDGDSRKLYSLVSGDSASSTWVTGQRRVGKTSLVQTFMTTLEEISSQEVVCLYLSTGELQTSDNASTINNLVRRIVQGLKRKMPTIEDIEEPKANGAFSGLSDYVDEVLIRRPGTKILVIIDEFDEFQVSLFQRGDGDAFFNAIRAISQKRFFGFVFVGGEKIKIIQDQQGDRLNHFETIELDYFSKATQFDDFRSMVQSPAPEIEFEDSALNAIYELTDGNPYFVNRLCSVIFNESVRFRDSSITDREVKAASQVFVNEIAQASAFQHFWSDGILETGMETDSVIRTRKIVLWSLIDCWKTGSATGDDIMIAVGKFADSSNREHSLSELNNYVARKILKETAWGYECRVELFHEWLMTKGKSDILRDFPDPEAIKLVLEQNKEFEVTPEEIIQLVETWSLYQGNKIEKTDVEAWLTQFGPPKDQRLMFKLLKNVKFYSDSEISEKLEAAHRNVTLSGLTTKVPATVNSSRSDIVVSHMGSLGHSGIDFAKLYAQAAQINRKDNIVLGTPTVLGQKLEKMKDVQAVVFVDDFVGTGSQLNRSVSDLNKADYKTVRDKNLKMVIILVAGFVNNLENIEAGFKGINHENRIHIIDELTDRDKAFSSESTIWDSDDERNEAQKIAISKGEMLEPKQPLGYGGSEALVVFPSNCPNNSLPILWKKTEHWRPLFQRRLGDG